MRRTRASCGPAWRASLRGETDRLANAATAAANAAGSSADAEAENLPAVIEHGNSPATPAIPTIPDVTRAAARWIRPLVPGFVAKAIDTSTHPLRTVRQVIEEVEEITLSLKRTHKITVHSEESSGVAPKAQRPTIMRDSGSGTPTARSLSPDSSLVVSSGEHPIELTDRDGPTQLHAGDGPRQLPPVE